MGPEDYVKETPETPSIDMDTEFTVKVDGEEQKVPLRELIDIASKERAADSRFR